MDKEIGKEPLSKHSLREQEKALKEIEESARRD
jgi:hypothetical protein